MPWQDLIESDPAVLHGVARIKGTRVPVSTILDNLAAGTTVEEIQTEYPSVTREAIQATLAYAADLTRERVVRMPA